VKLWDLTTNKLAHTLEGHIAPIMEVAYGCQGQLLASKGVDAIRLWRPDTGECLAVIPERTSRLWFFGLAFHPILPRIATVATTSSESDAECAIHIRDLDLDVLLGRPVAPLVTYTSAKIVIVGESNVGKSFLAHRIGTGQAPTDGVIRATHAMKFWPMTPEQLGMRPGPPNQRRDLVFWDMGGQAEYRLIHQLFLHDTTVALILFDPTRGHASAKEVETWNNYLEKQLRGRPAVKLLVGTKLDDESHDDMINLQSIERLQRDLGFVGFYKTSALTGRGVAHLCEAVAKGIDWDGLGKTSRPELFQRIRDEIERRRQTDVVVPLVDLERAVREDLPPNDDSGAEGRRVVSTVVAQLQAQGVVARSRLAAGTPVLVLQVQEVERYGGSLIMAARNNPRQVPALELRTITHPGFETPGIERSDRLPRAQELPVLEATMQILLNSGICFQHEGLLIFPTMFPYGPGEADAKLPHAVLLHYDFAGAIQNIYAALVASLVLARHTNPPTFGRLRLWPDRAEFEMNRQGLCGLRLVSRPGGYAHIDLYFEPGTPRETQQLFDSFVAEHLREQGINIRGYVTMKCGYCGHELDEETLRKRIARGDKDVLCPVCEKWRGALNDAAIADHAIAGDRDSTSLQDETFKLKGKIDRLKKLVTTQVVRDMIGADPAPSTRPIRLLHLSDLHFSADSRILARLQPLIDDLQMGAHWAGVVIASTGSTISSFPAISRIAAAPRVTKRRSTLCQGSQRSSSSLPSGAFSCRGIMTSSTCVTRTIGSLRMPRREIESLYVRAISS
jgi:GTPase SAR1 family protein